MIAAFQEARSLTATIKAKRGTMAGIAVEQGRFAVTETAKSGRKWHTERLTGWQSYAECLGRLREIAAA